MNLTKTKSVVFDFDGVLANTFKLTFDLVKDLGNLNITHEQFLSHHDGNVFEKPAIEMTEENFGNFMKRYTKKIDQRTPFFSSDQIKTLADKYQLFIISSGDEIAINKFLDHHHLNRFTGVYGYNTHFSKVKKFKMIFKNFQLQPEECLFVTDTLGDILEGKEVHVPVVAVDFGYHNRDRLNKGNPDKIISNPVELIELLTD